MTFSSFRTETSEPISFSLLIAGFTAALSGALNLGIHDAGQVSFRRQYCFLVRPVEIRAVHRSTQVGQKHAAAFQIQGDTDSFHQMVENNYRLFLAISLSRIHRRAVHRVATWRIASVRPVDRPVGKIQFEVNRFGQAPVEEFDVFAIGRTLALGNFEIGAKDASLASIVRTFLSPIKLSTFDVERDSHAPFLYVFPGTCLAFARIDERFDIGTIQVRAHDPHALAIAPVKLAVLLVELKLLGSEGGARGNNVGDVASVKIRTLDGAVVGGGVPHVGPVEVTCFDVHNDAVRKPPSFAHNDLQIGAVRIGGKYLTAARTEKEQLSFLGLCCRFCDV